MEKIDLHIHSTCSDGEKNVSEIINYAKEEGLEMIAITDHDDIESIKQIKNCNLENLKCVKGVEVSASYQKYDVHILCYGFRNTKELNKIIQSQKKMRIEKFNELMKQLKQKYNIEFSSEEIKAVLQKSAIGKNDIAYLLVKNSFVESRKEAFDKYITNLSTERIRKVEFSEIVKAMKKDDGIIIMAHPFEVMKQYKISKKELYELIDAIMKDGCNGIEAYHSEYNLEECNELKEYAKKKNYLISAGSDFHREENKTNDGIGYLYQCTDDKYKNINENDINLLKILREEKRWITTQNM